MASTVTIDDVTVSGTAAEMLAVYHAAERVIERLGENASEGTGIPFVGQTDDGRKTLQIIRVNTASRLSTVIVADDTLAASDLSAFDAAHASFMTITER